MTLAQWLVEERWEVVRVSDEEQVAYMVNFLQLGWEGGRYRLVTSHAGLKERLERAKLSVSVEVFHVEYDAVTALYGAAHCTTQALRIPSQHRRRSKHEEQTGGGHDDAELSRSTTQPAAQSAKRRSASHAFILIAAALPGELRSAAAAHGRQLADCLARHVEAAVHEGRTQQCAQRLTRLCASISFHLSAGWCTSSSHERRPTALRKVRSGRGQRRLTRGGAGRKVPTGKSV